MSGEASKTKRALPTITLSPAFRVAMQAVFSLILFALLVLLVQGQHLFANLHAIPLQIVAVAFAVLVAAYTLNSRRWQLLLRNVGVEERLGRLTMLYFIGQFWTLFLPTGAGGDAWRAYDVARCSDRPTAALVATLQERVLGLGASLIVGLGAMLVYLPVLPSYLRVWAFLLQGVGIAAVTVLLYPSLLLPVCRRGYRMLLRVPVANRVLTHPLSLRVLKVAYSVLTLPPMSLRSTLTLGGMAVVAVLMGVSKFYLFGLALHVEASFLAYCLVIPLVWIVRMVPFSLGGLGVGEGAFVVLMGLFGVAPERALAVAVAALGTQVIVACIGGVLLLVRSVQRIWSPAAAPAVVEAAPLPSASKVPVRDINMMRVGHDPGDGE